MTKQSIAIEDIPWNEKKLIVFFGPDAREKEKRIVKNAVANRYLYHRFPEHNLYHPWEHVEFAEYMTDYVNAIENRVCIITNSPYIIDHLTNLMHGYSLKEFQGRMAHPSYLFNGDSGSFIDKEFVGAYLCESGKIINAIRERGPRWIDWNSLSEVAEWLTDVYFDMNPDPKPEPKKTNKKGDN